MDKATLVKVLEIAYEEFDKYRSEKEQNAVGGLIDRIVELIES